MTLAHPGARFRTATLLLLVATIALVPPLVRATARIAADTASPLRLNRGFDAPPTKCTIVPPADIPFETVQHAPLPTDVERCDAPGQARLPDSPLVSSPDALRGPPFPPAS
jgi:hypothetical protein